MGMAGINELSPEIRGRLAELFADGRSAWERFRDEIGREKFHLFQPAAYETVLAALLPLRSPGARFLEWGSATGVIAIMADLLGFESRGIEIDARLVAIARRLARRHRSGARFAAGSYLPEGYRWESGDGDDRTGTIESGRPAYGELGLPLEAFDLVYAYPWSGEEPILRDVMRRRGKKGARLLLHSKAEGVETVAF